MAEASCAASDDQSTAYEYLQPVPPSLECPICRQPLSDPVLTPCDHLFCRACLSRALELHPTCPIDRAPIEGGVDGGGCRRPPRVVGELLEELVVKCEACECEMKRGEWEGHWAKCRRRGKRDASRTRSAEVGGATSDTDDAFVEGDPSTRSALREGEASEASTRPSSPSPSDLLPCGYCSTPLPATARSSHLLVCPLVTVPCPYASFGCPFRYPRCSLPEEHLESGECAYEPLRDGLGKARERWERMEEENWELRQRVGKLEGVVGTLVEELRAVKSSLGDFHSASSSAPPSLPYTINTLSASQTSLSTSLSSLSQSHTAHLSSTQHLAEELAALRQGVGALRMQMGGVMMDMQGLYAGSAQSMGGYSMGGGGWRRPGLRPMRTSSSEGEEGGSLAAVGGGEGSSASGSDDEAQPYSMPNFPTLRGFPFQPPSFPSLPLPLPFPPGMRPVFPSSASPPAGLEYDPLDARLGGLALDGGGGRTGGHGTGRGVGLGPGGRGRGGVKL